MLSLGQLQMNPPGELLEMVLNMASELFHLREAGALIFLKHGQFLVESCCRWRVLRRTFLGISCLLDMWLEKKPQVKKCRCKQLEVRPARWEGVSKGREL